MPSHAGWLNRLALGADVVSTLSGQAMENVRTRLQGSLAGALLVCPCAAQSAHGLRLLYACLLCGFVAVAQSPTC